MAIVSEVDFVAAFSDVKSAHLNAFTQVGSSWYFGYINTSHHGVLYVSTDSGVTWSLSADYGNQDFITATATNDGSSLTVAVSSASLNQITVYKDGSQVAQGAGYAAEGAVCLWPILFSVSSTSEAASIARIDGSGGYIDSTTTAPSPPIYAVIGYASTPGSYCIITAGEGISGWDGTQAAVFSDFAFGLEDPSSPGSPIVLKFTLTNEFNSSLFGANWVGLNSVTYSGYVGGVDFAGAGAGGFSNYLVPDNRDQTLRGTYFQGDVIDPDGNSFYIADRGLSGPAQTAQAMSIDGTPLCLFVDRNGLVGSTINDGTSQAVDSSGTYSPFGKAKIYGNTGLTVNPLSYSAPIQSGSMSVFLLTVPTGSPPGTTMTLYRLTDPAPLDRPHANNTALISTLTTVRTVDGQTVDPFAITTSSNALGPARITGTPASYGLALLIQACTEPSVLPNPNGSPGCSPILRELMNQSGVPFSVVREMANDGDPNGHQGGNALDLAGPSTNTVLTGASVTDAAYQEMAEITSFLRAVPELFASVVHYDPITPDNSLYIWDGKITTAAQYGGISAQIVKDSISNIHVSSSFSRLLVGFQNPTMQAALGLGPAVTDPGTGATTTQAAPDLFSADRYVYVNDDGYIGSPTVGLAVKKEPAQIINFW